MTIFLQHIIDGEINEIQIYLTGSLNSQWLFVIVFLISGHNYCAKKLGNFIMFFKRILTLIRGLLGGTVPRNPPAIAEEAGILGSVTESGRSPVVGNGNLLQYSGKFHE